MIQAQLSEALGCEPPSVTLMTRKLKPPATSAAHPPPPTSAPASSNSPTAAKL
jgi:hypothetical protein